MSGFIDYDLVKDIKKALAAELFEDVGIEYEEEERHVSELSRIILALDDEELFVFVRTLVKHRKEQLVKTLEYMNKQEGEKYEQNRRNVG